MLESQWPTKQFVEFILKAAGIITTFRNFTYLGEIGVWKVINIFMGGVKFKNQIKNFQNINVTPQNWSGKERDSTCSHPQ